MRSTKIAGERETRENGEDGSSDYFSSNPAGIKATLALERTVLTPKRMARIMIASTAQLISICCLHSGVVPGLLCGLPNSLPVTTAVSGGGDGTVVSEIFSLLSLCASVSDKDPQTGAVEQFVAAHSASAMLALASVLSLETGVSVESSICQIAVPLIPRTVSLGDHVKIVSGDENDVGSAGSSGKLSYWHGQRDGCVGLLESRLKRRGPLAVHQLCASSIPQLLIELLSNKHFNNSPGCGNTKDLLGLSPVGVVWAISSICICLSCGVIIFRQVVVRSEHIKLFSGLISDVARKDKALLKLVTDCAAVAMNPSRKDAVNESPLRIALFSLAKMCSDPPCRQFLRSSELFLAIGRLRQSPASIIAKYASVVIKGVTEA